MTIDKNFWQSKRVLVTGHTGFKGSWLSLWLQNLGAQVIGYAHEPPTNPSLFEIADVVKGMTSIIGDIRDYEHFSSVVNEHQPEIVIHMAAQPLVRYSYDNPIETYESNVMGTVKVLEAIRHAKSVKAVVNITTDKCYENKEWYWGYREIDPMGGFDPYSSSKGCAELVASAYRNSYFPTEKYHEHGLALASVRAGNVIGGGDWAKDRLIPDILQAIGESRPVIIRQPHSIRPWQHVLEPLRGYLMLAEKLFQQGPEFAEGWNFGPNDEDAKPVSWIVERLTQQWGDNASWQTDDGEHLHEAKYLKLDISKAKGKLGYLPSLDLGTSLDWIITWYRAYLQNSDMRELTMQQINDYEDKVSA